MRNNIHAYTAPGSSYPEYLSVNENEDGTVEITIRSLPTPFGQCGETASIKLSAEEFAKFAYYAYAFSCKNGVVGE